MTLEIPNVVFKTLFRYYQQVPVIKIFFKPVIIKVIFIMKSMSALPALLLAVILTAFSCTSSPKFSLGEPEIVASGFQFTEGPYWTESGSLIFSDIPANKVFEWVPGSDQATVYIDSSGRSNGIESFPGGSLVLAQHDGAVSEWLSSGTFRTLAAEYEGKRLNSPNDLAVRSDSLIFFTDPNFGVSGEEQELDFCGVYRLRAGGSPEPVYTEFALPNGITFSPDESHLYVNDSQTGEILRFEVLDNGDLTGMTSFANVGARAETGAADGMITDSDGRLYTTGPEGLIVFDKEGKEITRLNVGQQVSNVAWGGEDGNDLFITSVDKVYRVKVTK